MPFTVSHVVAVLPFTAGRLRRWFDPTALVIGAMVPDLPLFWPRVLDYGWSHDLLLGPLTYDLALGLVAYLGWVLVLRRPSTDLAPRPLGNRLPGSRALPTVTVFSWLRMLWSLVLGAYTHVLWDTFTHQNRLGSQWFPVLNALIGPLPLYKWLQYGGGVFGLVVIGWWLVRWWRRTTARPAGVTAPDTFRRLCWLAIVGATALGAAAVALLGLAQGLSLERVAFLAVTRGGAAAMVTIAICCLCWWIGFRTGTWTEERPDGPRRAKTWEV